LRIRLARELLKFVKATKMRKVLRMAQTHGGCCL
jgi:hypothetical protein